MAEAVRASETPKGRDTDCGEWELWSEPPEHRQPVGGRTKAVRDQPDQKGRKGATPSERFFKKRVMNGAQCYDNVREDKDGNVSRIHDWELLRSSAARATEKCLGKG